jgi:hypothetical protein
LPTSVLFTTGTVHWVDTELTVGGTATFQPTSDGTPSGNALFSQILAIQFTAELNTATATSVPLAALKSISGDLKTVIANVLTPTVLGVLGATMLAAPDGTKTHCLITGFR